MCGITGFVDLSGDYRSDQLHNLIGRMTETLTHRGPDDSGIWVDANIGVALGHRRLAIIDTSPEGHQPMVSQNGRYIIVFNGEIYNFQLLRQELEKTGNIFRGHSDTEVMLEAFEQWGIQEAVKRFIGMFAFALWDKKELVLYLVRDRLGIKPLYYGWMGKVFLFASELKALYMHPDFNSEIDRNSLALYLRYNNIPSPYSIYKNIYKIIPGTILVFNLKKKEKNHSFIHYWSAKDIIEQARAEPFKGSLTEAVSCLDILLRDAVKLRMISDVPLGAFMSGGVDSSTVIALMQHQSTRPVKTFTIGFYESGYNEAKDAKKVAGHLGTEHTELYLTAQEATSVIPHLPILYDEPFADSSQIPTFLLSRLTRQYVTVSLSGDGGDELFGGYNRYFWTERIWNKIEWMPQKMRDRIAWILTVLSPETWNNIFSKVGAVLPKRIRENNLGYKMHKLAQVLRLNSPEEIYLWLVSHCQEPSLLAIGASEPITLVRDDTQRPNKINNPTEMMMYLDLMSYLPDDILVKVDRASMGVSLEARVPLLDHRVVEFAWKLPLSMKIHNGQSKWILRQILYQYVPQALIERPKMGFSMPINIWLRGPLRDWAEGLINYNRLKEEGFFNPEPVSVKWKEHLSGNYNWQDYLWPILIFQAWKEHWL